MKNAILIILSLLFVSGCGLDYIRTENRRNLAKLSVGMSKNEVIATMGDKVVFDLRTTVNNPYRTEILRGKGKPFEVLYYYTDIKRADGAIADNELTPLVFDNGHIIGWGWGFLEQNVQKYEIRFR